MRTRPRCAHSDWPWSNVCAPPEMGAGAPVITFEQAPCCFWVFQRTKCDAGSRARVSPGWASTLAGGYPRSMLIADTSAVCAQDPIPAVGPPHPARNPVIDANQTRHSARVTLTSPCAQELGSREAPRGCRIYPYHSGAPHGSGSWQGESAPRGGGQWG